MDNTHYILDYSRLIQLSWVLYPRNSNLPIFWGHLFTFILKVVAGVSAVLVLDNSQAF